MKLQIVGLVMGAAAMTVGFAGQARADVFASEIDKAFFAASGDHYENAGIGKQFLTLVGLSFSDAEYRQDAASIESLYKEGLRRQVGIPISTQDLANPFDTSIQANPGLTGNY
jgi:hypothetical protein